MKRKAASHDLDVSIRRKLNALASGLTRSSIEEEEEEDDENQPSDHTPNIGNNNSPMEYGAYGSSMVGKDLGLCLNRICGDMTTMRKKEDAKRQRIKTFVHGQTQILSRKVDQICTEKIMDMAKRTSETHATIIDDERPDGWLQHGYSFAYHPCVTLSLLLCHTSQSPSE